MGGHLVIMLPGDGIGRFFGTLVEHFGFLPENRCFRHGSLLYREDIGVSHDSETRGGMTWFSRSGEALEKIGGANSCPAFQAKGTQTLPSNSRRAVR